MLAAQVAFESPYIRQEVLRFRRGLEKAKPVRPKKPVRPTCCALSPLPALQPPAAPPSARHLADRRRSSQGAAPQVSSDVLKQVWEYVRFHQASGRSDKARLRRRCASLLPVTCWPRFWVEPCL